MQPGRFDFINQLDPLVLAAVWGFVALVVLWNCVPPLGHLLGLTSYTIGDEDPSSSIEDEADHADLHRQLTALGFVFVGGFWETARLYAWHWHKTFLTRVWVSKENKCFACVYRLFEGDPLRFACASTTSDGALIWTGNQMAGVEVVEPDRLRRGLNTNDWSKLHAEHQKNVAWFCERSVCAAVSDDLPLLMESVRRVSARDARRYKLVPLVFLALPLLFLGAAVLLVSPGPRGVGPMFVFTSASITAGCFIGSLFLIFYRLVLLPMLPRMAGNASNERNKN